MHPHFHRLPAFILWLLLSLPAVAQDFTLSGTLRGVNGRIWLIIYDNDSTPRQLSCRINGGTFAFNGTLGKEMPVYAEIQQSKLPQPIPLFLDASQIKVEVDMTHPAASRITGSRATSQYRYALETCQDGDRTTCLATFVRDNPDQFFSPYILYTLSSSLPHEQLQQCYAALTGTATKSYHYRLLGRKIAIMGAAMEGQHLPDIILPQSDGHKVHLDSLRKDSTCLVLSFGATWCKSCLAGNRQMEKICANANATRHNAKNDTVPVRLIPVMIDKDERKWDNPMLQQLAIDYIPYIIILDPQGNTLKRDVRVWELERILNGKGSY